VTFDKIKESAERQGWTVVEGDPKWQFWSHGRAEVVLFPGPEDNEPELLLLQGKLKAAGWRTKG
jgi:hypothetical protein